MADNYVRLSDTISAKEGRAYIIVDGQYRELFEISSLKAQLELKVQERQMLGHRMTQHKVIGATGTGSMTMYFMNSEMLNLAIAYIQKGRYSGITLGVVNEDAQSTVGKQEVKMMNVLFKTIPVATLDDQSDDPITIETEFTFDDLTGLEFFRLPGNYNN